MQQCITRLTRTEPHSKDLSIGKVVTVFRFCKSMKRDARGESGLSHGSFASASSSEEPGYLFTCPESWTPRDWQSPLNRAPTHGTHIGRNPNLAKAESFAPLMFFPVHSVHSFLAITAFNVEFECLLRQARENHRCFCITKDKVGWME